jgi:hypothetical protein
MRKTFVLSGLLSLVLTISIFGQETGPKNGTAASPPTAATPAVAISPTSSPEDLAKSSIPGPGWREVSDCAEHDAARLGAVISAE